jgi:hypothetical protein
MKTCDQGLVKSTSLALDIHNMVQNVSILAYQNHSVKIHAMELLSCNRGFNYFYLEGLFDVVNVKMMSLYSSVLIKPRQPRKFNTPFVVADHGCCCRIFTTFYRLLNFVYDRGKIWVQLLSNFSVQSKPLPICLSTKLKDLLALRRVMETTSNLEDKVIIRGWH